MLSFREISLGELEELEDIASRIETEEDKNVEDIEAKYKVKYATGMCEFLAKRFPKEFEEAFGKGPEAIEKCRKALEVAGDVYFDKWDDNYPEGVLSKARATLLLLKEKRRY